MSDEAEYACSAMLVVLGDDLIPRKVTELLGLTPSQAWRRGERKSFVRDDGTLHSFDSVHEWGGWKFFIPDDKRDSELAEQLAWWCEVLKGREPAMRELEAQGYLLRMDCFVGASKSVSIEVSTDIQSRLSSLRLNLTFFFSPDPASISRKQA